MILNQISRLGVRQKKSHPKSKFRVSECSPAEPAAYVCLKVSIQSIIKKSVLIDKATFRTPYLLGYAHMNLRFCPGFMLWSVSGVLNRLTNVLNGNAFSRVLPVSAFPEKIGTR